jgi:branched-subunit amino acid aminotransferase/4-amino-4-deoxychorismate lyase
MITRGAGPELSLMPRGEHRARRVILVDAVRPPPPSTYARGLTAVTLGWTRGNVTGSEQSAAKLLSYVTSIRALQQAHARGVDDAIFVGPDDLVREASTSNLFVVDLEGRLVTPPEGPDVLAGITRAQVLALAPSLGVASAVEPVSRRALAEAREVFLTSSIREIASVVRVDGAVVGAGLPGEIARALHLALRLRAGATGPAPWE